MRNFVLLSLVQVLIFSQIHVFGYATAAIYIIYLLKLPRHTSKNELMVWGFLFGMVTDIFCNTPGIHSAAATAMAFFRNDILVALTHKGASDDFTPGVKSIKWSVFMIYAVICISIFYTLLFALELFSIKYFSSLILSTLGSTLLTMLFVAVTEFFTPKK